MRKLRLTLLLSTFLLPVFLSAQYFDVGLIAGTSNYQGDLSGANRAQDPAAYSLSYGLFARYNMNRYFSIRLNGLAANIKGEDYTNRNLSFKNTIYEASLQAEFYITKFDARKSQHISSPYIFVGAGGYYHNPKAELNGEWYDLQPLRTEGQGIVDGKEEYSLYGVSFPAGLGFRFALTKRASVGVEFGFRYTLTDYLDDISTTYVDPDILRSAIDAELGAGMGDIATALSYRKIDGDGNLITPTAAIDGVSRANPSKNDWYFIGGLNLSIALGDPKKMDYDREKIEDVMDKKPSMSTSPKKEKKGKKKKKEKKAKKAKKKKKSLFKRKKKEKDEEDEDVEIPEGTDDDLDDVDWDIDGDGDLDEWEDGK